MDWNAIWKQSEAAGGDHVPEESLSLSGERMSQVVEQVIVTTSSHNHHIFL
jgi:hypothetical protein